MVDDELLHKSVAIRHVSNIRRIGHKTVAFGTGFCASLIKLGLIAPTNDGDGTRIGKLVCRSKSDAR